MYFCIFNYNLIQFKMQRKTRKFKLINKEISGTTGSQFPLVESLVPKAIIVEDDGREREIAWLSGRDVFVDQWKGFEGSIFDRESGLSFKKPVFNKGYLEVGSDNPSLQKFLDICPSNERSPYAGQKGVKITFTEIVEAESAAEEAKERRMRSKLENYIFDLGEKKLYSIAMLYGVRIKDSDGFQRDRDAISLDIIDRIYVDNRQTFEEFIENSGSSDFEIKTNIAQAFIDGILNYDTISGQVSVRGGNPIYRVQDKDEYITDVFLWVKSEPEGANLYKTVLNRLGKRKEEVSHKVVEVVNTAVTASGLLEAKGLEIISKAKEANVIKWEDQLFKKLGGANRYYVIKDEEGNAIKSKNALAELLDRDEELRDEVASKTAALLND